jgi:serine/threonine protein kinase
MSVAMQKIEDPRNCPEGFTMREQKPRVPGNQKETIDLKPPEARTTTNLSPNQAPSNEIEKPFIEEIEALNLTPVARIRLRPNKASPCALCKVRDQNGKDFMIKIGVKIGVMDIRNEAEMIQLCQDPSLNPGLISIAQSGQTTNGFYYFVMPFLVGESLHTRIKRANRSETKLESIKACAKVLRTLHQIHRLGVVHADIKPENIIFDSNREPVIIDMGSAYVLNLTGSHDLTPAYTSPESIATRLHKDARVSPASDLFSTGIIIYEILSNDLPFYRPSTSPRSKGDNPIDILQDSRKSSPDFGKIPKDFQSFIPVLEQLLAYDPKDRFDGSALKAALAIEQALNTATFASLA